MGVTTTPVEIKNLRKEIRTSVTLENSETGVYIVNTKIMGYVEKLFIDFTGQSVKKGQPLLTMYSPDLVSTQEEYLQALRYAKGLSGGSQIARDGAQGLVESAKRRLLNWDISETQIESLGKRGIPEKSMTISCTRNRYRTGKNGCCRPEYRTRYATLQNRRSFSYTGQRQTCTRKTFPI